jgi:hypothetical protein
MFLGLTAQLMYRGAQTLMNQFQTHFQKTLVSIASA